LEIFGVVYFISLGIMAEEFIGFDELCYFTNPNKQTCEPELLGQMHRLYQVQNVKDNGVTIKYLGNNDVVPTIAIYRFNFKKYICEVVSYILTDVDISRKDLRMLGLRVKLNENIVATITMKFNRENHLYEDDQNILSWFYSYELEYRENGQERREQIGEAFTNFPGRTKSVYDLIELLSDDKLFFLFDGE
jgi:hypothetical protein